MAGVHQPQEEDGGDSLAIEGAHIEPPPLDLVATTSRRRKFVDAVGGGSSPDSEKMEATIAVVEGARVESATTDLLAVTRRRREFAGNNGGLGVRY